MTAMEHVEDNVKTLTDFKPLTAEEQKIISRALAAQRRVEPIDCTYCDYCVSPPCPAGINIASVFRTYNECVNEGNIPDLALKRISDRTKPNSNFERQKRIFLTKMNKIPKKKQPVRCTDCFECIDKCPQNVAIAEKMKYISDLIKALEA